VKAYEGRNWKLYNADCVEFLAQLPDNSIDFSVYSSPFSSLYVYSDSERDLGNAHSHEDFFEGFMFFAHEMFRVMKPGTVLCDYVKDLLFFQGSSETGESGIYPFSDKAIEAYRCAGFQLRSRTTIWTDPVRERSKTQSDRLLHKSIGENSRVCGTGMPEYILVMRKDSRGGRVGEAVRHAVDTHRSKSVKDQVSEITREQVEKLIREGIIDSATPSVLKYLEENAIFPVEKWTKWASPVWMENGTNDVLNSRFKGSEKDERHLTPTPLPYIKRCMNLYSNPGDVVFDPFSGIGSTGVVAVSGLRKFIGTELKPEYAEQAAKFIKEEEMRSGDLFAIDATHALP
jgi:DNA modification methylase